MCLRQRNCCSWAACGLIALLDVILGIGTVLAWLMAMYYFKDARKYLARMEVKDDVAWYGIVSIPIVALIGIVTGLKLFRSVRRNNFSGNHHLSKALVFFIAEGFGFAAPFYLFKDYVVKIELLTAHLQFIVFHLLSLNPFTIGLFIYQVVSFAVVHCHQQARAESRSPPATTPRPKPMVQTIQPQPPIRSIPNGDNNSLATLPINSRRTRVPMYPDLQQVRVDLMTLPPSFVVELGLDSEPSSTQAVRYGTLSTATRRYSQPSFAQLKRQCHQQKILFEDKSFPATNASLGSGRWVEWKRPFEIALDAQFFTDGFSRFDVRQGELGDCWFLAAVAGLTCNSERFAKVVPADNVWTRETYSGICHFMFWVDGAWKEIIIDDRLPTRNRKLIYLHSTEKNEFWSALLEKAYAKLNGTYADLDGNDGIGRAMVNLTGGEVNRFMLQEFHTGLDTLYKLIEQAIQHGQMVGCCTSHDHSNSGIPGDHAYSITGVKKLKLKERDRCYVVRIRNPWGSKKEWTGEFGDRHPIWELVDESTKLELELIYQDDGEFWFPLRLLPEHFDMVETCWVDEN